jgi:ribonuclease R
MARKRSSPSREKREGRKRKQEGFSAAEILGLMEGKKHSFLLKEVLFDLGLKKERRREVRDQLEDLVRDGKLVKVRRNRYALPSKVNLVVGKLKCHPDGYGFVIPEKEGEADVFINPRNLKEAMHGDRVVASIESSGRRGREGRIVRVLERKHQRMVGTFIRERHDAYVLPEDEKILQRVRIPEEDTKRAKPGQIVVAEITHFPGERTGPQGRITQILGYPDDPEVEVQVILHKYDLPYRFSPGAAREAQALALGPMPREVADRVDLREIPTFTIDGEKARDFDDAVSIEREADGSAKLYVSISDVSHYVGEGTALDEEAYLRGTSVYFPDRAISMFPAELSNEICCLHPRVDRLTMTVELAYDGRGTPRGVRFYPSIIRSDERLTYTLVRKILIDDDRELRQQYRPLVPSLEAMADLSQALRRRRMERGAIDFDLPEPEVILNLQGEAEEIIRAERNLAHQIIEEFMIAANEAVARFMEEGHLPFLYRIHEPPSAASVEEFRKFISHLGLRMKKESAPSPKEFQRILLEAKGRPEEKMINNLLLRSMRWARYSARNLGHFGLASTSYTHFTSPIRRYPDLIVHRLLKRALSEKEGKTTVEELASKADHLSQRERVAMEAEREIVDRYRVRFMKDKIGELFDGVISGVATFGLFVELQEVYAEGLVKLAGLRDDYYQYDEKRQWIVGARSRKVFKIGDEVRVKVERVDVERRHIDLVLAARSPGEKVRTSN